MQKIIIKSVAKLVETTTVKVLDAQGKLVATITLYSVEEVVETAVIEIPLDDAPFSNELVGNETAPAEASNKASPPIYELKKPFPPIRGRSSLLETLMKREGTLGRKPVEPKRHPQLELDNHHC